MNLISILVYFGRLVDGVEMQVQNLLLGHKFYPPSLTYFIGSL